MASLLHFVKKSYLCMLQENLYQLPISPPIPFGKLIIFFAFKSRSSCCSFLDNEQSAADGANFMKHVKFNGIDEDLTAPGTPWIYYGVG